MHASPCFSWFYHFNGELDWMDNYNDNDSAGKMGSSEGQLLLFVNIHGYGFVLVPLDWNIVVFAIADCIQLYTITRNGHVSVLKPVHFMKTDTNSTC